MEFLIPQAFFDVRATWLLLILVIVSMAVLIKGAGWFVDGATGLAYRLGIPKVIIGATVVSMGTTSPEAAVSVMAAWSGEPGLALGNAVGSVVADTGLIFGACCLAVVLPADRFVLARQGWVQISAAILLAILCYSAWLFSPSPELGRPVGVLLLVLLIGYMVLSVRWSRQHPGGEPFQHPDEITLVTPTTGEVAAKARQQTILWLIGLMLMGVVVVILASRVLICSVSVLAGRWGVPQVVIAATLVAFGTSLPELATAVASLVKGHKELLVGNVIGADILNILFVIGASAVASPLPITEPETKYPEMFLLLHLPMMLAVLVLFRVFIALANRQGQFSRWMGAPLVTLYVSYVVGQYLFGAMLLH